MVATAKRQADSGLSLRATVRAGTAVVRTLLERLNERRRETFPASKLVVGLNCGGSDGYSGITANPALGHASDLLVAQGATTVLAETPEVFGTYINNEPTNVVRESDHTRIVAERDDRIVALQNLNETKVQTIQDLREEVERAQRSEGIEV